jgi:hypothetical protein
MSAADRIGVARAGSRREMELFGSHWDNPVPRHRSGKVTARLPLAGSARFGCGGGPIDWAARTRSCPFDESGRTTPGAKTHTTGATTGRSTGRPMNQATACGGTMAFTISSLRSTTIRDRAWPAGAAPFSSMWRGRVSRPRRAVSRWRKTTFSGCLLVSHPTPESWFILSPDPLRPRAGSL